MAWPKGKKHTASEKKKIRKSVSRYYREHPAACRKMSRIKKKQYRENPSLIRKIDSAITNWWRSHPNIRKINSKRMKEEFAKHPEAMKNFMKCMNNPFKPHLRTRQGFLVRSKGELAIANFLFENKINSQYEAKPLQLDGTPCVPDFWLPKFKTYIEFYGGYPGSWKKKVLKNKLYKKHKIKCVAITPAELRDLGYYLRGELR